MARGKLVVDLLDHFYSKLIIGHPGNHWSLDTFVNNKGYHTISVGGNRKKYGHVVSHELFIGPIPDGMEVDHQCNVTWCCNWRHLKAMTHADNIRRAYEFCGAGEHDLSIPGNFYDRGNGRKMCRPCSIRRCRERRNGKR